MRFASVLLLTAAAAAGQSPLSPWVASGDLIYVSGQGARDGKGQLAPGFDAQARQCLDNVGAALKNAGVTFDHVVYAQVYLADIKNYEAFNRAYAERFPKNPPARSTIGVTAMPGGTTVEVSAVAVRDVKLKKVLSYPGRKMPVPVSPAVQVGSRVYLTGGLGRVFATGAIPKEPREQVKLVMDEASVVLKAAGLELRHLVAATVYVSPKMPMPLLAQAIEEFIPAETARTVIQTAALPFGVDLQITGVASREIQRLGHCTGVKDTMYCAARGGTIRQALESIRRDLEANKSGLDKVVAVNVFMDDMAGFAAMNKVYAGFFGGKFPTRTTVQPWKAAAELAIPPATGVEADGSPKAQVAVIATGRTTKK